MKSALPGLIIFGAIAFGLACLYQKMKAKPGETGPRYTLGDAGAPMLVQDQTIPNAVITPVKGNLEGLTDITRVTKQRFSGGFFSTLNTMPTNNPVRTQRKVQW